MATALEIASDRLHAELDQDEKGLAISEKGAEASSAHTADSPAGTHPPAYDGHSTALPSLNVLMRLAAEARAREADGPGALRGESAHSPEKLDLTDDLINARRALRTASWFAVFYLITTDILGPFNAPFAFSQVGFVPGAVLYIVMGGVACYTGLILWKLFCQLDSDEYPVKTYADLGHRIFGNWFKNMCAALQSLQLIINVGTICLGNAQSVAQIAVSHEFCFSVGILIWAIVGMIIGQVRTLKNYGWLANSAVWLNLTLIFITMGVVAHSSPNVASAVAAYGPVTASGPVSTSKFVSLPLFDKINGIMQMVFAYGGAMIFPEFMAEMRRPMDFWKAMCCAQLLIVTVYMMFGIFVYAFQGQYTLGLAYQGMSKFAFQTVGNSIALVTGIIAAGLYGNIGIKVAYYHIVEQWFRGPPLMSRRGRIYWTLMVLVYWALAFIVGSAIPQVQTISGLVAAICIMQFTYTFPPLLWAGMQMRLDAAGASDGSTDPGDTWREWTRWRRALGTGAWHWKIFNLVLFLASLACACLGMYGSGKAIQATFQAGGAATSFGCGAPV